MTASKHLRGIVIAGALAAVALGLGSVTLAMNQSDSHASTSPVILKHVHHVHPAVTTKPKAKAKVAVKKPIVTKARKPAAAPEPKAKPKPKPKPDPNYTAALAAGLPADVAHALAAAPVVVVQLSSATDPIAALAAADAKAGAKLAGAQFVEVNVDKNGGPVQSLTRALGSLPDAPATLVYVRPSTVFLTLTGYNDRTTVQQAVANAEATLPPPTTGTAKPGPARVSA